MTIRAPSRPRVDPRRESWLALAGTGTVREIGGPGRGDPRRCGMLRSGDVLVVAGKGHETGQIIGDRTLPFSDHDVVRSGDLRRYAG